MISPRRLLMIVRELPEYSRKLRTAARRLRPKARRLLKGGLTALAVILILFLVPYGLLLASLSGLLGGGFRSPFALLFEVLLCLPLPAFLAGFLRKRAREGRKRRKRKEELETMRRTARTRQSKAAPPDFRLHRTALDGLLLFTLSELMKAADPAPYLHQCLMLADKYELRAAAEALISLRRQIRKRLPGGWLPLYQQRDSVFLKRKLLIDAHRPVWLFVRDEKLLEALGGEKETLLRQWLEEGDIHVFMVTADGLRDHSEHRTLQILKGAAHPPVGPDFLYFCLAEAELEPREYPEEDEPALACVFEDRVISGSAPSGYRGFFENATDRSWFRLVGAGDWREAALALAEARRQLRKERTAGTEIDLDERTMYLPARGPLMLRVEEQDLASVVTPASAELLLRLLEDDVHLCVCPVLRENGKPSERLFDLSTGELLRLKVEVYPAAGDDPAAFGKVSLLCDLPRADRAGTP